MNNAYQAEKERLEIYTSIIILMFAMYSYNLAITRENIKAVSVLLSPEG